MTMVQTLHTGLQYPLKAALTWLGSGFMMALCFTGCTTSAGDPEYALKMASARTDGTGKEIVGVWLSKTDLVVTGGSVLGAEGGAFSEKKTLLIRPDGTGLLRGLDRDGQATTINLTWKYAGNGVWTGASPTNSTKVKMRYTGHDLLYHFDRPGYSVDLVFVPADDASAVEEHLRRRADS